MLIIPGSWGLHWIVNRQPSSRRDGGKPAKDRVTPIPITTLNFPILLLSFMVLVSTWATYDINLSLPKISGFVLGLGGGLLAHLIFGLTDAVALGAKPGLLFWMLLALITGLYTALLNEMHQASGDL